MSTIDKILEVLDQPTQHPGDSSYPTGNTAEDSCWRCGCPLKEANPLGACSKCITDLRSEEPVLVEPTATTQYLDFSSWTGDCSCPLCATMRHESRFAHFPSATITIDEAYEMEDRPRPPGRRIARWRPDIPRGFRVVSYTGSYPPTVVLFPRVLELTAIQAREYGRCLEIATDEYGLVASLEIFGRPHEALYAYSSTRFT